MGQLISAGNTRYYCVKESDFKNIIMDEFGAKTISAALADGVTCGGLLAGAIGFWGRRVFQMGSSAYRFTTSALNGLAVGAYIISACAFIVIKLDQYETDEYNEKLQDMAESAILKLKSKGSGYLVIKTVDYYWESASGNATSGAEPLVVDIYWSSTSKGTRLDD